MSSNTTLKLFNKFSNSLIKDFISHLESNDIEIPSEISNSFLMDKPSKRKGKLSPYTVFMKEFRSNYQKQHPELSFEEVSRAIAEEWTKIKENPQKLKEYGEKAEKYNHNIPLKQKKICKATKGSDNQPCQAEAKSNSDYCGRHKKLAFDHVDPEEDIISANITSDSEEDYLSCQTSGCDLPAESGPHCANCFKNNEKKCIKEKANGQICGKKATKGEYCGFHNPNKPKRTKKTKKNVAAFQEEVAQEVSDFIAPQSPLTPTPELEKESVISNPINSTSSSSSSSTNTSEDENNFGEKTMYYDESMNIYHHNVEGIKLMKFITYAEEPIAYNEEGDEIGVIKNNKLEMF